MNTPRKFAARLMATVGFGLVLVTAQAQTSPDTAATQAPGASQSQCQGKGHGEKGHGTEQLPRLAGQVPRYIEAQLKSFNTRARTNDNEIMHSIASKLTELEVVARAKVEVAYGGRRLGDERLARLHEAQRMADLARRGHVVKSIPHLGGPCAMQAIRVLDNGVRQAGSDPRRDGWAGAY